MPYQPAVLGTARLNNFRLDYLTPAQAADRPTHIRIILGGIDITKPDAPMRVIYKSLTIRDALFEAPNTCEMTLYGAAPNVGQPLEVWINSDAPVLLFGGELQTVNRTYKGRPTTGIFPVTGIDDTARANRRRPLVPFVNTSATTIAQYLVATYAPGFSAAGVEAGLPNVSITFDGSEAGMKGCLTALAKLIGAYWYFENKTLYFFVTPPGTPPDPIDDTPGRFLHDPPIAWTMDKSQVRTRVYGKGASTQIATSIAAGEALVPLVNAEMFNSAGGQAIAGVTPDGAACRVLTYMGVQLGGGGGLVGPGAAPGAAPGLVLHAGTGMDTGAFNYAVTFVTAAGESIPSPIGTITTGPIAAPASAPTPGAVQAGGAIEPGTYQYAVTFATASGETTSSNAGPGITTTVGAGIPSPGITHAALRKVVGNLANGVTYAYKTTITKAGSGETLPGPVGSSVTPTPPTTPGSAIGAISGTYPDPVSGGALQGSMYYAYWVSFIVGGTYETALSPLFETYTLNGATALNFYWGFATSPDARVTGRKIYRSVAFASHGNNGAPRLLATLAYNNSASLDAAYLDTTADASLGAIRANPTDPIGTPPGDQATVTVPTSGDVRAVGRKIYRSDNGAPFRYLATISNNTATQYIDNTASVSTQPDAPTTDTSGGASYQTVPLSGIAVGPPTVTARKLYRWTSGVGWRLVTTIANNTATTYTDSAATASLGGTLPAGNTTLANQVSVTVAIGPSAVTARKIYRTLAGQLALRLLATIANNTQNSYTDLTADGGLGVATPPVTDTSGLTQPSGQVPAGSTALIVANPAPFPDSGGWAVVGNGEQVIRYTGKSATSLTGIPASGPGAIVASIAYSSTVTAAAALVGVTGLVEAVIRNAQIFVWIQRDDLAAQAYMAALDGGGDGVYEHIWSDERRSEASLRQVCDAQLELYSRPLVTVVYASRDLKTKSGKTATIALTTPAINEALTIQDVQISELGIKGLAPKFTVTASSVRQSLEAVLQMLIRKADA